MAARLPWWLITRAPWTEYVSTRNLWANKIPGADLTVYWRTTLEKVILVFLLEDEGS